MKTLSVMIKPASGSCNMKCDYCFYCDEMQNRQQQSYGMMSEQTLKNVILKTMLQTEHHISFAFQGGEPTLRGLDFFRRVVEYQKQYGRSGLSVTNALQTNGYALDEEWCRFFRENRFLIGVSVDGTPQIHDALRHSRSTGDGTFDRVFRSIGLLERHGVDFNILTVVTEHTARNIRQIYDFYKKQGWNYQQYIECLDPLGEPFGSREYSLTPETFGIFLTELFELWYEDCLRGRQPYIRKFENYVGILAGYQPEACEQRGVCGQQLVVEADGSAYPCDFYMLDEYRLGNFNTERLPAMAEKRLELGFVARSAKISAQCRECPYYSLCRSGCHRSRQYLAEEDTYRNHFCQGYRYFFDRCLPRMQEIAKTIPLR